MKNKFNLLFIASAVLIELFLLLFTILNLDGNIPLFMFIYFQFFLLFLLAFYLVKKDLIEFHLPRGVNAVLMKLLNINKDLSVPLIIILFALVFRITLFPTELTTSPDALRYIWEGKVIVNGYNPYVYEPLHEELRHLHTPDLPSRIHYNEMKAIYPPVAQYLFATAYLISGEDLWGLKLLYLLFDLFTMIFLLKLLHLKKINMNYLILYAWLPLTVLEYFVNAHLDVFGLSFFVIFLYFLEKKEYYSSSVFYALACLSRFFPLFIFPLLFKQTGLKNTFIYAIVLLLLTMAAYLPFLSDQVNIFSFLLLYLERWEFNASVYYFLGIFLENDTARMLCAAMFIISIAVISYYYKLFTRAALGIFISMILFTSTVYPWYLGWLAVLNPFHLFYSVLSLFFTINLTNLTPLSPEWREYTSILLIEYITFFLLLMFDLKKNILQKKIAA
jgi:alpha-1,6-mannosyltransferase